MKFKYKIHYFKRENKYEIICKKICPIIEFFTLNQFLYFLFKFLLGSLLFGFHLINIYFDILNNNKKNFILTKLKIDITIIIIYFCLILLYKLYLFKSNNILIPSWERDNFGNIINGLIIFIFLNYFLNKLNIEKIKTISDIYIEIINIRIYIFSLFIYLMIKNIILDLKNWMFKFLIIFSLNLYLFTFDYNNLIFSIIFFILLQIKYFYKNIKKNNIYQTINNFLYIISIISLIVSIHLYKNNYYNFIWINTSIIFIIISISIDIGNYLTEIILFQPIKYGFFIGDYINKKYFIKLKNYNGFSESYKNQKENLSNKEINFNDGDEEEELNNDEKNTLLLNNNDNNN